MRAALWCKRLRLPRDLKRAKETGEPYLHYKLEMRSEIAERLTLEHKLREAIDEQLQIRTPLSAADQHRQPGQDRVGSNRDCCVGTTPEQGLVLPGRFLPVLESSGMISRFPVGKWVVQRRHAGLLTRWPQSWAAPGAESRSTSRRSSFGDAHSSISCSTWSRTGRAIRMDSVSIYEITETALLQDIDGVGRQLRELRAAGFRDIALG